LISISAVRSPLPPQPSLNRREKESSLLTPVSTFPLAAVGPLPPADITDNVIAMGTLSSFFQSGHLCHLASVFFVET
jgi:hypothetical protein